MLTRQTLNEESANDTRTRLLLDVGSFFTRKAPPKGTYRWQVTPSALEYTSIWYIYSPWSSGKFFTRYLFWSSFLLSSSSRRRFYLHWPSRQAAVPSVVSSPPRYVPSFLLCIGFEAFPLLIHVHRILPLTLSHYRRQNTKKNVPYWYNKYTI